MARRAQPPAFGAKGRPAAGRSGGAATAAKAPRPTAIPRPVANRMARRIAIATGVPTLLGMAVFVASYLLVSRGILAIPPAATLLAAGACFLVGLLGLSYGVLSASWEEAPGTLMGFEQMVLNIGRLRDSARAMRGGSAGAREAVPPASAGGER